MPKLLPKRELGRRLVELRKAHGYPEQGDFVAALGKTQSEVSRWENGKVQASYDTVVKWAEVLGVSIDEFLEPSGQQAANGEAVVKATVREIEANGGISEVERYYLDELRRIAASDAPESIKILDRDSLASSIARLGNIIADRAAEARARAIEKAESAAEIRAKAIERAEETATLRTQALGKQQADALAWEEMQKLIEDAVRQAVEGRQGGATGTTGQNP